MTLFAVTFLPFLRTAPDRMKPATSTAAPARDDEALRAGWEEIGQVDEYDRLHAPTSQEERYFDDPRNRSKGERARSKRLRRGWDALAKAKAALALPPPLEKEQATVAEPVVTAGQSPVADQPRLEEQVDPGVLDNMLTMYERGLRHDGFPHMITQLEYARAERELQALQTAGALPALPKASMHPANDSPSFARAQALSMRILVVLRS